MLLEISWTIEFFSLARPARKPRPPPAGVFSLQSGALTPQAPPLEQRPYVRLMSPRPRGARDGQGRELIDRVAAGAPVCQLLFVKALGHKQLPFARFRRITAPGSS